MLAGPTHILEIPDARYSIADMQQQVGQALAHDSR